MMKNPKAKTEGVFGRLTSYGDLGFSRFLRGAFLKSAGYDTRDFSRPVVGIADNTSDYTTCHRDMPKMIEAVKRGVLESGAIPLVFPTISLGEILIAPTSMLYRNLLAMETEEMIRAYPMDAVVLMGGCDKTPVAQLMAAASADIPAISVVTGPMLTGTWRGERLGACTDCRRLWSRHRSGELSEADIDEAQSKLCQTGGTCMVMGTASTVACLIEALGMMPTGGAAAPSSSGDRLRISAETGRLAVKIAQEGLRPSRILTRAAFENAIKVLMAIGGSTNGVIHLTAIARRAGIRLTLEDFARISAEIPLLVDCKPSGKGYLEDFHRAGGMPALLKTLEPTLDTSVMTVTGKTLGDLLKTYSPPASWQDTIRTLEKPLGGKGAIAALKGSLAPEGAVIKRSAASPALLKHRGPAVVFDSVEDVTRRIDDPSLKITPEHILVMRNAGPVAAGMPEAGSMPIPRYLAEKGVKDMVRVSDARMSGTAYGTVVLHVAPEAAVGGPLALVRDGDLIELDSEKGTLELLVAENELENRRREWKRPGLPARGYARLYAQTVEQAHLGADLDFLGPVR